MKAQESVPSVREEEAAGEIGEIFSDIRKTLGTSVVNLIWRHLATMPGALPWTWSTVRPLYLGSAANHAEAPRRSLRLPAAARLSFGSFTAARILRAAFTEVPSNPR